MYSERGLFIDGAGRRWGGAGENPVPDPATGESHGSAPSASVDDTRANILQGIADAMIARSEEAAAVPTKFADYSNVELGQVVVP